MSQYASAMNSDVRVRGLDARDQRRPVLGVRAGAGALAPGAREHLVGHQHRHVAAHPVALRADVDQRLGDRARAAPARTRRAARRPATAGSTGRGPRATIAAGRAQERRGVGRQLLLAAVDAGTPGATPPTDGRARRGWARSRGSAAARAPASCRARRRQRLRPAEALVDDVVAHAVGRADHVARRAGPAARRGCPHRAPGRRRAIASPAGLRSQTPISHTASTGSAASASHSRAGTSASVSRGRGSQTAVLIS